MGDFYSPDNQEDVIKQVSQHIYGFYQEIGKEKRKDFMMRYCEGAWYYKRRDESIWRSYN